ncbi:MAG: hypothetical protein IKS13_10945 [Ruminococcus sp.]|nr:hypothetical protein [Ruminococcus sp.]
MVANAHEFLYWKTNPEWYDYDENEQPYLTDKAPLEAREAFKKYLELMKQLENHPDIRIL